jgi:hypothetical protein
MQCTREEPVFSSSTASLLESEMSATGNEEVSIANVKETVDAVIINQLSKRTHAQSSIF